jgi:hypothetical protein
VSFACNMGYLDRAARLVIGSAFLYIALINPDLITNQVLRYVLAVLGTVNIITALIAFCPLYTLVNIDTRRKR